jgi:hypothetical protein
MEIQMSRFAVIYEDPSYEEPEASEGWVEALDNPKEPPKEDILTWLDEQLA